MKVEKANTMLNLLLKQPFFINMEVDMVEKIAAYASIRDFFPNEEVINAGDPANEFYIIIEGEAEIDIVDSDNFSTPISILRESDLIGWSWFYYPFKWQFSAKASSELKVLVFDATAIKRLSYTDHKIGYEVMKRVAKVMAKRLKDSRILIKDLIETPASQPY